jgi:hypothetical protein
MLAADTGPKARRCLPRRLDRSSRGSDPTHEGVTPPVHPTTARPVITRTIGGAGDVSHMGSRLMAGLADRSGLTEAFSDALDGLRERGAAHDPGRILTDLAVLLGADGRSISDLAMLRHLPTLLGAVASTATAWQSWTRSTRPGRTRYGRSGRSLGSGCGRQTSAAGSRLTESAFQRRATHRVPRSVHGVHQLFAAGLTVPETDLPSSEGPSHPSKLGHTDDRTLLWHSPTRPGQSQSFHVASGVGPDI